jgi:hypothetical protein
MLKICNRALCLSIWRFRLPFLKRDASAYDHFSPWTAKAKAIACEKFFMAVLHYRIVIISIWREIMKESSISYLKLPLISASAMALGDFYFSIKREAFHVR